ncbi:YdjY domain-containing protein [Planctomycetes bacterium Pan216]
MNTIAAIVLLSLLSADGVAKGQAADRVRRLTPELEVDLDSGEVRIDAQIVLREGPLELLLCPKGGKEHESILAATIEPRTFQTALLLAGAKPGHPARFEPYKPPTGQQIEILLDVKGSDGKMKRLDAREWIQNVKTKKPMDATFVFTGSQFVRAPGAKRATWLGDEGDLVCVANFPGSVIDIAKESTTSNADLLFIARTAAIPEVGTPVRVIFKPVSP